MALLAADEGMHSAKAILSRGGVKAPEEQGGNIHGNRI